jgi:methyltransferase-like protein
LRIAREQLTSNGIAHVSYNVLPGWRMHQPLRDAFRMLIPSQQSEIRQVEMARELLGFMAEVSPDTGPYGEILRGGPVRLAGEPADYIYHEYLEQTNQPCTFAQFAAMARRAGLEFLAECDLHTMLPENIGADFARRLRARISDDIYSVEQMMDVLTGRSFRETLLVPREREPMINRKLSMAAIEGLHLRGSRNMKIERSGNSVKLTDNAGRTMTSQEAAVGPAIERLVAAFPASITIDECATHFGEQDRTLITDALFRMLMAGILTASIDPIAGCMPGKQPRGTALARADAAAGAEITANWAHEAVAIDPVASVLLPAMDGKTDRKALEQLLCVAAMAGRLNLGENGAPLTDPAKLRSTVRDLLPKALIGIADAGLIDG